MRFSDAYKAAVVIAPNDAATAAQTATVDAVPESGALAFVVAFTTEASITPKITVRGYTGSAYEDVEVKTYAAKRSDNTYVVDVYANPKYTKFQLKVEGSAAGTFAVSACAVWRRRYASAEA